MTTGTSITGVTNAASFTYGSEWVAVNQIDLNATNPHTGTSVTIKKSPTDLNPKYYFKFVKKKFGLLGGLSMARRMKKLEDLVNDTANIGQTALSEEYFKRLVKEVKESEMYAMGYKIFLEEEHLEKFRNLVTNRGIKVTPLKNFTRVIPPDVQDALKKAQAAHVFDTFVIVHYDPASKNSKLTEKEELERKKDPILFGLIQESTRYYYIADWEDEYCDLTLDDIVDKLNLEDDEIKLSKTPSLS